MNRTTLQALRRLAPLAIAAIAAVHAGPVRAQSAAAVAAGAPAPGAPETLAGLLERVLGDEPSVRVSEALHAASEQRVKQARSRMLPNLGLVAVKGENNDVERVSPALNQEAEFQRRTERSEVTLRWNVFNFGNDQAELEGSKLDVRAARQDVRRSREEAGERIAQAYADVLRFQSLLPRSTARLDAMRRLAGLVQKQNEAGKLSDADALQVQTTLLDAEVSHAQLVSDHVGARERLSKLIGEPSRPALPIALPPPSTYGVPDNGQLAAARERVAAANARVRPVWSAFTPRIDAEYRKRLHDNTRPRPVTDTVDGWSVSARWDVPLGGESIARVREAEHRARATAAEADRVERSLASEMAALPVQIAQAAEALQQIDRQLLQYEQLIRAGELQYEAGRRTLAQVAQLHESRYLAEQRRAEQLYRMTSARIKQLSLNGSLLPGLATAAREGG